MARPSRGRRAGALAGLLVALASPAGAERIRPDVVVVPFRDRSGAPEALAVVMPRVREALRDRRMDIVAATEIDPWLRAGRIRARDALSLPHLRELWREMHARYALVGTVDAFEDSGGPAVGLSARLIDTRDGQVVWAGSVTLHAVDEPGLLAAGRARTLDDAATRAARRLCASIRVRADGSVKPATPVHRPWANLLAPPPITYRKPGFRPRDFVRIAVLPLSNHTVEPVAPAVVGDQIVARLLAEPLLDVVEPGELRRVLIENDLQPLYGVDREQLPVLVDSLDIDAVLDGTIVGFDGGATSSVPRLDLMLRLRDARTGEVLWSATTDRDGEHSTIVWDLGSIRSLHRLAEVTVDDLLHTWLH